MHRSDVLTKYGRYLIGTVSGQKPTHVLPTPGTLSPVPYAEAMWLTEGYKSPYYNDSHRRLQKFIREFNDEYVRPDAQLHELDGKRPTPALIQKMGDLKINHMVRPRWCRSGPRFPELISSRLLLAHGSLQGPARSRPPRRHQGRRL